MDSSTVIGSVAGTTIRPIFRPSMVRRIGMVRRISMARVSRMNRASALPLYIAARSTLSPKPDASTVSGFSHITYRDA
jgi:hypothetical protein